MCTECRKQKVLEATAAEIRASTGGRVIVCAADVRDVAAVRAAVDSIEKQLGTPTLVVNNAAANFVSPTERLSTNAFKYLYACTYSCYLLAHLHSCIISIYSTSISSPLFPLLLHHHVSDTHAESLTLLNSREFIPMGIFPECSREYSREYSQLGNFWE